MALTKFYLISYFGNKFRPTRSNRSRVIYRTDGRATGKIGRNDKGGGREGGVREEDTEAT